MSISNILSLFSGVALFLFGMSLMGDGLKKVAGSHLETLLYKMTNTSLKGILLGTGVTAVIQSSSATSAMVVGFVNSNMMGFRQAIGIILGAILGTSVTGWVICLSYIEGGGGLVSLLSTSTITAVVAIIGICFRMFSRNQTKQRIGDIMLGFAVLMFGMSTMSGSVSPLKQSAAFISLLTRFSNPFLGILVGLLFTALLQSASAAVGILQALTMTGAIDFSVALPLIMGIAIGAALPVLVTAIGANINGRRSAYVYLLINAIGSLSLAILFYAVNAVVHFSFMNMTMNAFLVALVNSGFRLIMVLLLGPAIPLLEKLTCSLVKDKEKKTEERWNDLVLEDRFLPYPTLAISQCRSYVNAMAKLSQDSIAAAVALLDHYSEEGFQIVADLEDQGDRYEDRLGTYLFKIGRRDLTEEQSCEVNECMHMLSDLERISDHALNIAEVAKKMNEKGIQYSPVGKHEINVVRDAMSRIVDLSITSFLNEDTEMAGRVEPLEELIDRLCDAAKKHHVDRMRQGTCDYEQGFTFNDLLTNFERVSDHCSNVAVAVMEIKDGEVNAHEYVKMLEEKDSFEKKYEEFSKEFYL